MNVSAGMRSLVCVCVCVRVYMFGSRFQFLCVNYIASISSGTQRPTAPSFGIIWAWHAATPSLSLSPIVVVACVKHFGASECLIIKNLHLILVCFFLFRATFRFMAMPVCVCVWLMVIASSSSVRRSVLL